MHPLPKNFATREALIAHVKTLASWAKGEHSNIQGGRQQADRKLATIDPIAYAEYWKQAEKTAFLTNGGALHA